MHISLSLNQSTNIMCFSFNSSLVSHIFSYDCVAVNDGKSSYALNSQFKSWLRLVNVCMIGRTCCNNRFYNNTLPTWQYEVLQDLRPRGGGVDETDVSVLQDLLSMVPPQPAQPTNQSTNQPTNQWYLCTWKYSEIRGVKKKNAYRTTCPLTAGLG